MTKHRLATRIISLLIVLLAAGHASAARDAYTLRPQGLTNQLIVRYDSDQRVPFGLANAQARWAEQAQQMADRLNVNLRHVRSLGQRGQVVRLPAMQGMQQLNSLMARMQSLPGVSHVEPDLIMTIQRVPNDARYNEQWHYFESAGGLNLPSAWDNSLGAGVTVAVIDTGVRPHADLVDRLLPGYDFISDADNANDGDGRDPDATDPGDWAQANECGWYSPSRDTTSSWHGTHVAGTIAASSNNGIGVAGVAWQANILPIRVLGKCGGYTSDIVDGMRWAAGLSVDGVPANPSPAKVINLSLGGQGSCGQTYKDAIAEINAAGASVVVAAGNSSANASNYTPASCPGVITVGATNRNGGQAFYSNYGSTLDVSAPGGETSAETRVNGVLSTLNSGSTAPGSDSYGFYQGTSMAAPHVAGVAALMYAVRADLTPTLAKLALTESARAYPQTGGDSQCDTANCGAGIVDAAAAVALARIIEEEEQNSCTEHTASVQSHLNAGRAQRCWGWYGCAVGSGDFLGFVSTWGSVTVAETSAGYFEAGSCSN